MEAKPNVAGSAGSNYDRTIPSEVVESDSESEFNRTIENREECSRSPPKELSVFKAEKQETVGKMLKKVAPALLKPSGSQLSLPMMQLRALAFDTLFACVPDPQSVSLIHNLLHLGDQLPPEEVCFDNCYCIFTVLL